MTADWIETFPAARTEDLVITESGKELLVYDTANHQLHQLNPLASTVWRSLDGNRNAADVLVLARATTGQEVTADSIRLALSTLGDANLLASPIEAGSLLGNQSRRGFLKKMGIASIPAVVSVTVPLAVAHASGECGFGEDCFTDSVCQAKSVYSPVEDPDYYTVGEVFGECCTPQGSTQCKHCSVTDRSEINTGNPSDPWRYTFRVSCT